MKQLSSQVPPRVCFPRTTTLKKTNSPVASSHQLPIAFQLGVGLHTDLSRDQTLTWSVRVMFVHGAATAPSSHVLGPAVFLWMSFVYHPWLLQSF